MDEEEKRLEAEVYDELLEMYDDLEEPASLQSVGGLSRMDTIAGPASIGEVMIASPDLRIEQDRAPTPFRRKGGQGVENDISKAMEISVWVRVIYPSRTYLGQSFLYP